MKAATQHRDLRVLMLVAGVLFAASAIVRFALADYPKGIGVLPDEIRYLNLASSLLNSGELVQRGGLTSFQKILYPLALAPAYLLDDPQARVRVITLLNCIYVSSAVFPALVLARRLFSSKAPIIACLCFTILMPDMTYSMTFLTESVYLPLALWLIACCLVALERRGNVRYAWCVCAGLLCYLSYLCKEVALGFALAFVLMLVIEAVSGERGRRESLVALTAFAGALALPFILLKLTLFSGLLNSYNQADPRVLLNPYTVFYLFYAIASDATHFAIAFAFFPLVFPAFTWHRLKAGERRLYLFCVLSFVFILFAVVYTISIREDLGHVGIRPHVRYVAPIFLPLFFLFLKQVMRADGVAVMRNPRSFALAVSSTIAMAILVIFMLGSGDYSQGFDNAQFHFLRLLEDNLPALPIDPAQDPSSLPEDDIYNGEYLPINAGIWIAKLVICLYLIGGLWLLLSRRRVTGGMVLISCIVVMMLVNNVGAILYNKDVYQIEPEDVEAACAIDTFINEMPDGEQLLFVYDEGSSGPNNLLDVYIDNARLNCAYIVKEDFDSVVRDGDRAQRTLLIEADATMGDNIYAANGRMCDEDAGISYIVVNKEQNIRLDPIYAHDVTPDGVEGFTVYKIDPGAPIAYARSALVRAAG